MSRPKPVPKTVVCSECGLDWDLHPENPRRRDCIQLLKDRPVINTYPYQFSLTSPPSPSIIYDNTWEDTGSSYGFSIDA